MMSGGVAKTYWAEKEGIDPKKIVMVSVMPCTSKKYEIRRPEFEIYGLKPVDHVLTTRELATLFKKHKIDLKTLHPEPFDNPLSLHSGAGVIYGASGGVMESALRSTYEDLTGKTLKKVEFKEVRGQEGLKKSKVRIGKKTLNIAIANGIENAEKLIQELKTDPHKYDYIEVMACPGGCIGGGGQPIPTSPEIRQKRADSLYKLDTKNKLRKAHKNPALEKVYEEFLTTDKLTHYICHSEFSPKKKTPTKHLS